MDLTGTVLNVVDFGCFVDIGMHDSGLVHVSRLADRFIRDPHEVVAVGDVVKVWVMDVDKERRRVSLTMVRPGSERPRAAVVKGTIPDRVKQAKIRRGQNQAGHRSGKRWRAVSRSSAARPPGPARADAATASRAISRINRVVNRVSRPEAAARRPASGSKGQGGGRMEAAGRSMPVLRSKVARPQGEGGPGGKPREEPSRQLWWSAAPRSRPQGPGQGRPHEFKPKPKPLIPITDAMKKGKEPMRTFGDLMQFFGAAAEDEKPPARNPSGPGREGAGREASPGRDGCSGGPSTGLPPPKGSSVMRTAGSLRSTSPALRSRLSPPGSVSPAPGEPSPEPQTPPADESQ